MGILDEAIREHLELKRQHGADEPELKQLEDEAFGPAERPGSEAAAPDALAEAATEFMEQPDVGAGTPPAEPTGEASPREEAAARIAGLQEAPAPPAPAEEEQPPPAEGAADADEPVASEEGAADEPVAAAEDAPAPSASGPSTEEREVIAEQPTEMFDVEGELGGPGPAPSEEDLVDEEISGPRLAPVDPLSGLDEGGEIEVTDEAAELDDEDDDFWDEQRLSDELDQALEAPLASDRDEDDLEEEEDEAAPEAQSQSGAEAPIPTQDEDAEAPAPRRDEDVLEETPDFLEETPEDDELWFEQKPPKDFDFDD